MCWDHFSLSEKLHLPRAQAVSNHLYISDFQLLTNSSDVSFKLQISIFICLLTISVILQIPKMVCYPNAYLFFFFCSSFFFFVFSGQLIVLGIILLFTWAQNLGDLQIPQFMFSCLSRLSSLLLGFCFLVSLSFPYFTCFFLPLLLPQTFNMLCLFFFQVFNILCSNLPIYVTSCLSQHHFFRTWHSVQSRHPVMFIE